MDNDTSHRIRMNEADYFANGIFKTPEEFILRGKEKIAVIDKIGAWLQERIKEQEKRKELEEQKQSNKMMKSVLWAVLVCFGVLMLLFGTGHWILGWLFLIAAVIIYIATLLFGGSIFLFCGLDQALKDAFTGLNRELMVAADLKGALEFEISLAERYAGRSENAEIPENPIIPNPRFRPLRDLRKSPKVLECPSELCIDVSEMNYDNQKE